MAVLKDDVVVVGRLPRQLLQILPLFILRNGSIDYIVTVEEDISQICHKEDSKILVNYF